MHFVNLFCWFLCVDNEIQGILVLIDESVWRSREGSKYASWLIYRWRVDINQRTEVVFLTFILTSQ